MAEIVSLRDHDSDNLSEINENIKILIELIKRLTIEITSQFPRH